MVSDMSPGYIHETVFAVSLLVGVTRPKVAGSFTVKADILVGFDTFQLCRNVNSALGLSVKSS